MQQPQSILWHLQHALDNAPRQGTMQCQETCRMATDTINLQDEGGMRTCNCKCKGTESIKKNCPLLLLLWLDAFSLGNQIHNSQLLLAGPNNVWPVTYLRQRYSRLGAINNKQSTHWKLPKLYTYATIKGGAKDISMGTASKVQSAHESTNCCLCCGQAHEASRNKLQTTHATPIVLQSALRAAWAAHQ